MTDKVPPRLYVIPATEADIALVFGRGPARWWHLAKWNIAKGTFEHGAWLSHNIYALRCDVSPDGRWLLYFAASYSKTKSSRTNWPESFIAISRLPWVHALAAWAERGTFTSGCHFEEGKGAKALGDPFVGKEGLRHVPYALEWNDGNWFGAERRRGWHASPASDRIIHKACPDNPEILLEARITDIKFSPPAIDGSHRLYRLIRRDGAAIERKDLSWADWTRDGRLMGATTRGTLIIETLSRGGVTRSSKEFNDMLDLKPDPQPAPGWAARWR